MRALVRYFRDPSASVFGKLFVLLAVVYVVSPVDLIPDVPFVGWLDDIGVMGLAMSWLFSRLDAYREVRDVREVCDAAVELPPRDRSSRAAA